MPKKKKTKTKKKAKLVSNLTPNEKAAVKAIKDALKAPLTKGDEDFTISSESPKYSENPSELYIGRYAGKADMQRLYKVIMIEAITNSLLIPNEEMKKLAEEITQARKVEGHAEILSTEDQEKLEKLSKSFFAANLYHNPYLRRAFRAAVVNIRNPTDVHNSNAKEYGNKQGAIRREITNIIIEDDKYMKFTEKDFRYCEYPEITWQIFQYIKGGGILSGSASAGRGEIKLLMTNIAKINPELIDLTSNSTIELHHIAWKKALNSAFEAFSLNPVNLIMVSGTRKKDKEGSHARIHKATASSTDIYKEIDPIMIECMVDVYSAERTSKPTLYQFMLNQFQEVKKKSGRKERYDTFKELLREIATGYKSIDELLTEEAILITKSDSQFYSHYLLNNIITHNIDENSIHLVHLGENRNSDIDTIDEILLNSEDMDIIIPVHISTERKGVQKIILLDCM